MAKIGIIGAGIAGLSTAWMLDEEHSVTLFERKDYLGGHAHTFYFKKDGVDLYVDSGASFYSPSTYPLFCRLLDLLEIRSVPTSVSASVYRAGQPRAGLVTPNRQRLAPLLSVRNVLALSQLQLSLSAARRIVNSNDWSMRLGDFVNQLPVTPWFRENILLPWLASMYGVQASVVREFSVGSAFYFPVRQPAKGALSYHFQQVEGGIGRYPRALAAKLRQTCIRVNAIVRGIERVGETFVVTEADGSVHRFDALVIATPPYAAAELLGGLSGSYGDKLRSTLREFPFFDTRMAIHSDPSYMPLRRADWSHFNTIVDDHSCEATIWKSDRGFDLFKSWTTYRPLPAAPHAVFNFRHPILTPGFSRAQYRMEAFQGIESLWFAGSYLRAVDSHETALETAVDVVSRLSPRSHRLRQLRQRSAGPLAHEAAP